MTDVGDKYIKFDNIIFSLSIE